MICGNILFGPDVYIGNYSYIHGPGNLSNVTIGKYCGIAKRFSVITSNHHASYFTTYPLFRQINSPLFGKSQDDLIPLEHSEIGNDVWIGESVTIMGNIKIGDGAVIGACSFVNKDIPPYSIAAGVPVRIIKYRFSDEKIKYLQDLKWWNWQPEDIFLNYYKLNSFDAKLKDEKTVNYET